ncbi:MULTISPECIES: hypothetical protein [Enterococcus]|uniref:hypothetical protein n=1 Tax=Enterococcus diestrammenae TaxID=1155073 RepID=UPI00195E6E2A
MNLAWMAEMFNKEIDELNRTIEHLKSIGVYDEKVQDEMVAKGILGAREQIKFLKGKYLSEEVPK